MTPAEVQRELEELETRLERLRIQYDLYFTGIEKSLPFVARKDVDRRFTQLHRENLRNTGLKFRFNTLVQRFTMYQTYWNRIIRQIEEGTWRRDQKRAARMGSRIRPSLDDGNAPTELSADELEEVDAMEPEPAASASSPAPAPTASKPPTRDVFDFDIPPVSPRRPSVPRLDDASEPAMSAPVSRPDVEDFTPPPRALTPPPRPPAGGVKPPAPFTDFEPLPSAPPAAAAPSTAPRSAFVPSAPRPATNSTVPIANTAVPGPVTSNLPPRPTAPAPATFTKPPLGARPVAPGGPAAPSMPARPAATAAPPRPAPSGGDDPAMRQLYDRYIAARKQTGENADLRYESVAKQVRESLPRLTEKYQGADVRLDVTIKDGKAILRPVVTMKKGT